MVERTELILLKVERSGLLVHMAHQDPVGGRGQQGLTPGKNTFNEHLMSTDPLQNIIQHWIKHTYRCRVSPSAIPP